VSQLYSLVENFQSEHRKLKESRNASVGLFWREKKERKKERPQKQRDDERARERDDVCIRGVARDTKKSPHVPQQMKVRRNWTRGIFFSFPLTFLTQNPKLVQHKNSSRNQNNKHQHATTMRDDEHD
jgi:hypothetical protein